MKTGEDPLGLVRDNPTPTEWGPEFETIESIEEVNGDDWDGFRVKTDKQSIEIFIDNRDRCCETWGYIHSDDDLKSFVGSHLYSIDLVADHNKEDIIIDIKKLESSSPSDQEGGFIFVNLMTNLGILQLALYNQHNGYYSHSVVVRSKHLSFKGEL